MKKYSNNIKDMKIPEIENIAKEWGLEILKNLCKSIDTPNYDFSVIAFLEGKLLELLNKSPVITKQTFDQNLWSLAVINAWNRYTNPQDHKYNAMKAYGLYRRYNQIIDNFIKQQGKVKNG